MDKEDTLDKKQDVATVTPSVYRAVDQSDEIDLVDLWIAFWDRRWLFLSSVVVVTVIGIAFFETLYAPRNFVSVRSLVEIQEISIENPATFSAFSAALAKGIKIVDLPRLAAEEEFNQAESYLLLSDVNAIKGTNFIEIVTNGPVSAVEALSKFHDKLAGYIVEKVKSSSLNLNRTMHGGMPSIDNRIIRLRASVRKLNQAMSRYSDSLGLSDQQKQDNLAPSLKELASEIDDISEDLVILGSSLQEIDPRVVINASVSESTKGITKPAAYSLIILLAVFLSIFILAGAAFVASVRDRMASRS